MSATKQRRHTCKRCNEHPALHRDSNGRTRWSKGFDLCGRCLRSDNDKVRAWKLVPDYGRTVEAA